MSSARSSGRETSLRRLRLIHWNVEEAQEKVVRLEAAGYEVDPKPLGPAGLKELRQNPPAAVVIDLSRMPAQGRDVAVAVRHAKSTRAVPIVFVDGDAAKVERIKKQLPDAVYTTWGRIRSAIKKAIAHPPSDPVAPESVMAGYSGTPLPKKLGIKPNSTVILVGAPEDFEKTLGALPEGVKLRRQARGQNDLVIWFAGSRKDLKDRVKKLGQLAGQGGLWIAWPKQASGVRTDLTQTMVRETGLANGLVDYKICAIDETWSGLRFARRKS